MHKWVEQKIYVSQINNKNENFFIYRIFHLIILAAVDYR